MDTPDTAPLQPTWTAKLDPREQAQIAHARHYRQHFSHAGAPGHGQFLLLAKLADMLDAAAAPGEGRPHV